MLVDAAPNPAKHPRELTLSHSNLVLKLNYAGPGQERVELFFMPATAVAKLEQIREGCT